MLYPKVIQKLIESFTKLPGVGKKTAERYCFDIITKWSTEEIESFACSIEEIKKELQFCQKCSMLVEKHDALCSFCVDDFRNKKQLCMVASIKDVYSIERTSEYQGVYYILPTLLSPLDGRCAERLELEKIIQRIKEHGVSEIIFALDSSIEGDATSLYLKQALSSLEITFYRIAFGIPVGSSLEYVDGGTLTRAFCGRCKF